MSEDYFNDGDEIQNLITDDVIINLRELSFETIKEPEVVNYIHWQCQKVLQIAKDKNDSKEVARAINLYTLEVLGTVMGEMRRVDIDYLVQQMQDLGYVFVVIHNHPSDMHFSVLDIKTFVNSDNLTILVVLGNCGSVYILEKTRQLELNEVLSIKKTLRDWQNQTIAFDDVVEQISKFGIVYKET